MKGVGEILKTFSIALVLLLVLFLFKIIDLFADYLWFESVSYTDIFLTILQSKVALFIGAFVIAFTFIALNIAIALRLNKSHKRLIPHAFALVIIAVISLFFAMFATSSWMTLLQYIHASEFNVTDPLFSKDISFYVFELPLYTKVLGFIIGLLIVTIILVAIYYLQLFFSNYVRRSTQTVQPPEVIEPESLDLKTVLKQLKRGALIHLIILVALMFGALYFKHVFSVYQLLFSPKGLLVGATYADVHVVMPALKLLGVLSLVIAASLILWIFIANHLKPSMKAYPVYAIVLYVIISFIGLAIAPSIVQSLVVSPNEINLEKEYIEYAIKYTRQAYNLDNIQEETFDATKIDVQSVNGAKETLDNIRILDWRPLTQTYKQTQEIRLYYDLSDVDIDRYTINGQYTQVMLSARELDQSQIASNAQTWVNMHMIYTHGYGVVMSPVNKVTKEGLPEYLIKDIPPINVAQDPVLDITNPRVYFGEKRNAYMLVNTKTQEFDYPKGNTNEYNQYDGEGGVLLDTFAKKLVMALKFKDIKILLSSDFTDESKIMYVQNIKERVNKIAPFLYYDSDPYLVINNGELFWMLDAYTATSNYPYSERSGSINYIRNSVKVIIDAYDGTVTYYIADKNDPIITTYADVFEGTFKSIDQLPDGFKEHMRYPEGLFTIQAAIYSIYHMEDPTVFYNKEDAWQIPYEVYGVGQKMPVEPYYVIMKLPGYDTPEFVLMISFSPSKKDNMIAWFSARSDGEYYGELVVYKFPKDKLVYGPLQIEAKIDQDSEISQQLTLWSQQGSRVTRGNLLVIPIDDSLLYIEPLYLQAETGQLPELKRVIVSDGERVVMEVDLKTALDTLFDRKSSPSSSVNQDQTSVSDSPLVDQAQMYYDNILDSMQNGDWTQFGENFDKLGNVIEQLRAD